MKLIPIRIASGSFMESDDGWASTDIATVNRNVVRCRTMERIVAPWHVHADSDELFYILSGQLHLDTDEGTATVGAGELLVVPAGTRHRGRAEGRTTMLVIDRICSGRGPATL
jgi:mannose-6-phosphate isomerase-like protein (cupin superfamily)